MANCKHCNDELTYILVESKETVYYNLTKDGDIEHDGSENSCNGSNYLCPSCTGKVAETEEEAIKLMNTISIPRLYPPENMSMSNILEDVECLITDCTVFANSLDSGSLDEPWDTSDFDNWQNMVYALERIKKYIELISPKQTP